MRHFLIIAPVIVTQNVSKMDQFGSHWTDMPNRQKKTEGIKIMVTAAELAAIDQFADHGGHWSRAEAVRRLIQKGYATFRGEQGLDGSGRDNGRTSGNDSYK